MEQEGSVFVSFDLQWIRFLYLHSGLVAGRA